MQLSPFFKQPLFWLLSVGVILLLVLSFWYIKRPMDANGQSLILSRQAQKKLDQDLARQAALRSRDSVQAAQAQTSANVLYQHGQQEAAAAAQLRQQNHAKTSLAADTGTQQLQRTLSNY